MRIVWTSHARGDDLAWAKEHVDAARADLNAGNVVPAADVITRLRSRPAN